MKKHLTLIVSICIILFFACLYFIESNKLKTSSLNKITVAEVTHSLFYSPFYSAIANGYFEEENIEIELLLTPGADNVMAAVLSNDVDIGFSGSEATIYVYNGGEKDYLQTFAQLTQKDGSFIVSREKIKNFKLTDLKGKTIIGGRAGGMPEMTLEWALKKAGLTPGKDVKIDTSVAFAAMSGSFIGGNGDFVSLFEPNALQIEQQGYGYVVASLGELGGVVPYTSYSARKSYIKENSQTIEKFERAIQRGLDYIHKTDDEQIAKDILNQFPNTSLNDLTKVVTRYKKINAWPKTTEFSEKSVGTFMENITVTVKI